MSVRHLSKSRCSHSSTHQICQRIELLAHQTTLASSSRYHAVEEVEEQPERHEPQRHPQVAFVTRIDAVSHRGRDGHEPTKSVHQRDEVGKVVRAEQAEVTWVR